MVARECQLEWPPLVRPSSKPFNFSHSNSHKFDSHAQLIYLNHRDFCPLSENITLNALLFTEFEWTAAKSCLDPTLAVLQDVGGKPSLVSHVGGILAVLLLDDPLQRVVQLRAYPQSLPKTEGRGQQRSGERGLLKGTKRSCTWRTRLRLAEPWTPASPVCFLRESRHWSRWRPETTTRHRQRWGLSGKQETTQSKPKLKPGLTQVRSKNKPKTKPEPEPGQLQNQLMNMSHEPGRTNPYNLSLDQERFLLILGFSVELRACSCEISRFHRDRSVCFLME